MHALIPVVAGLACSFVVQGAQLVGERRRRRAFQAKLQENQERDERPKVQPDLTFTELHGAVLSRGQSPHEPEEGLVWTEVVARRSARPPRGVDLLLARTAFVRAPQGSIPLGTTLLVLVARGLEDLRAMAPMVLNHEGLCGAAVVLVDAEGRAITAAHDEVQGDPLVQHLARATHSAVGVLPVASPASREAWEPWLVGGIRAAAQPAVIRWRTGWLP